MLETIVDFFRGKSASLLTDAQGHATDEDLKIATGVALLEIGGSDDDHAPEEARSILETMATQFNLQGEEVIRLLEIADEIRTDEERVDQYYSLLSSKFQPAQKQKLFAMVWKVVLADGRVDKYELRLATQLRFRLQLSDEAMEAAKRMAEDGAV